MTSAPDTGWADQHLGESLAALIDGELSHDRRDRVLAHLATCPSCKAEADAQRRLKSVFAQSPLPAPSEGLLARLQGLPATDGADLSPGDATGGGAALDIAHHTPHRGEGVARRGGDGEPPAAAGRGPRLLAAARDRASLLSPAGLGGERGFRIHEPGAAVRLHRGQRFAFAAAGAVSLAAFAIGGAMTSSGPVAASAGGSPAVEGNSSSVAAARVAASREERDKAADAEASRQASDGAGGDASPPVSLVAVAGPVDGSFGAARSPAGLAEQLFPAMGTILAAGPDAGSTTTVPAPMLTGQAPVGWLGGLSAGAGDAR